MQSLQQFLHENSQGDLLPWAVQVKAKEQFGLSYAEVEDAALWMGLLPARYQRNRETISLANQLRLFRSHVAVIGCGGLGGYIIEELARLGVGKITALDPDVFEEHNLNRQLLSSIASLGQAKVEAAAARVAEINPAVTLVAVRGPYTPANGQEVFKNVRVVVDALDDIATRLALAKTCMELNLPLVHGAIAGWYGQVTTQFPGETTIEQLYSGWNPALQANSRSAERSVSSKGVEQHFGNPAFTPAVIASLEVAEVCKVLIGAGEPLHSRKLSINLLDMTFEQVVLESEGPTARRAAFATGSDSGR
jgi:molybdopterin/thiamine biosynthesis adenylyltransferase